MNMKNTKKAFAALLCALLMLTCAAAMAEPAATPVPIVIQSSSAGAAEITVQGSALLSADPDMVTVQTNASAMAGSMAAAQEQIAAAIENVTGKLMELGVLGEDIVTSNYSYYPNYNYETNTIIGYEANHSLSITCRDVEMLDSVIGVLTDCGLNQIYDVSFDISTRSQLYRQALELAIRAAEEKAQTMAAASGRTLTGLKSIEENEGYSEGYAINARADMVAMKAEAAGTGIRSGGVSVSARVTAVYTAE